MKENNIRAAFPYILCIITAVITYLMIKMQIAAFVPVVCLIIAVASVVNLKLGLAIWFIVSPLSTLAADQIESVPILFNPAIVMGALVNLMYRKKRLVVDSKALRFYMYVLATTVLATLYYRYNETTFALINFIMTIMISCLIIVVYNAYDEYYKNIGFSLMLSGLIAFSVAVTSNMEMESRLGLDGSVRQLSNILSFSSMFIVLILFFYKEAINKNLRLVFIVALVPLITGLILTVSRGSILAFIVSVVLSLLLYFYKTKKIKTALVSMVNVFVFMIMVYFLFYDYVSNKFSEYISLLEKRFEQDELESGSDIRQYIWERVLSSFDDIELFFGTGIGGFRYKSALVGVNFYSHSVYVDIIATCGLGVLAMVFIYLIVVFFKAYSETKMLAIGICLFMLLNFFSHGSVTSPLFWICLALCRSIVFKKSGPQLNI